MGEDLEHPYTDGVGAVRDAATVMLVRDAPDLEVFMLRRNLAGTWVGGAHLFPGGAVDRADRSRQAAQRSPGRDDRAASALLGVASGGLGFWVAAVRESFEEAGVLLARPRAGGALDLATLEAARGALNRGERSFLELLAERDLVLDVERLHVFSHWITPVGSPRRYDTWFFVADAPAGHAYLHDDVETVESFWIRPADAIAAADRGEMQLIVPTRRNLEALSRFRRRADLLGHAEQTSAARVGSRVVPDGDGARIALPGDPGQPAADAS